MATNNITRLLGKSRPLGLGAPSCLNSKSYRSMPSTFMVLSKVGFQGEKIRVTGDHGQKKNPVKASHAAASESVITSKTETSGGVDIAFLLANVTALVFHGLKVVTRSRPWKLHVQMFIEKVKPYFYLYTFFYIFVIGYVIYNKKIKKKIVIIYHLICMTIALENFLENTRSILRNNLLWQSMSKNSFYFLL